MGGRCAVRQLVPCKRRTWQIHWETGLLTFCSMGQRHITVKWGRIRSLIERCLDGRSRDWDQSKQHFVSLGPSPWDVVTLVKHPGTSISMSDLPSLVLAILAPVAGRLNSSVCSHIAYSLEFQQQLCLIPLPFSPLTAHSTHARKNKYLATVLTYVNVSDLVAQADKASFKSPHVLKNGGPRDPLACSS